MAAELYRAVRTCVDILAEPQSPEIISRRDSQLLFGENFNASRIEGDWLYGVSAVDGYSGYVRAAHMERAETGAARHKISVPLTHLYPRPDFKTRPLAALPFLSQIQIRENTAENGFIAAEDGWIFSAHLKPADETEKDLLKTALQFLHAPYLYGGRSALGIDCSGLVQLAILNTGISCPRDSNQQTAIGREIGRSDLKAGDLVFFKGHVGLMTDETRILNATARTMDTRIETLSALESAYGQITALRRL